MTNKEALEILFASNNFDGNYHDLIIAREKLEQALDRLKKLEKVLYLIKAYLVIPNDAPLMDFAERCYTEEECDLLEEVLNDE